MSIQTMGPSFPQLETVLGQVPAPRCEAFESQVSPEEIRAGEALTLRVKFTGVLTSGLLSAMLVHRESGALFWAPNADTWVPYLDTGTLNGPMRAREWEWKADIPPWILPGYLLVSPGVWEDPSGIPGRRRHVAVGKHEITVGETKNTTVVQLCQLYRQFLGREPDVIGLKNWYDLITTERAPMGRILVDGFLKSVELRVDQLHRAFSIDSPIEDRRRWVLSIQKGAASLEELITHLYSVAVAGGGLTSNQSEAVRKVATRLGVPVNDQTLQRLEEAANAAHKDLVPVALLGMLNDDSFLVVQLLQAREPDRKVDSSKASSTLARLKSAKDPDDFLWLLWTRLSPK